MNYLYGSKDGHTLRLVATFSSEEQLLAYVHWATLKSTGTKRGVFEEGSALEGYDAWDSSTTPMNTDAISAVYHNPTPSML